MARYIPVTLIVAMLSWPAFAASEKVVAAIAALDKLAADTVKVAEFCKINKDIEDTAEQDQAKLDALDRQMGIFQRSAGRDVEQAFDLAEDVNLESADGQALEEAFLRLESKCEQ